VTENKHTNKQKQKEGNQNFMESPSVGIWYISIVANEFFPVDFQSEKVKKNEKKKTVLLVN